MSTHVIGCPHHDRDYAGRVCSHLLMQPDDDYVRRFSGVGQDYELLCLKCAGDANAINAPLLGVCSECFQKIEEEGYWEGILGRPEIRIGQRNLGFQYETIKLPGLRDSLVIDLQPIEGTHSAWLACTSTGSLIEIDLIRRTTRTAAQTPSDVLDTTGQFAPDTRRPWLRQPPCMLRVSRNGQIAAVANTYGRHGAVLDLRTGNVTMTLCRDDYHPDVSAFPLALAESGGRIVVIHGTGWNRLDISEATTGVMLTQRHPTSYKRGEARPPHYLDYFHCQLSVSPGQQFIADDGWVWHPAGIVATWSLARWLQGNVWESEDGPSKKALCVREYYWDGPLCWIDDHRLAVWGYGRDDEWLIPAVTVYDVRTGNPEPWFAGPKGSLAFDEFLFSFDREEGTAVWDVTTGERVALDPTLHPVGYHRGGKHFLSLLSDGVVQVSRLIHK